MIFIDSNIWCYYFDKSAKEHEDVVDYLEKVLQDKDVLMNTVVVMEIAHYLIKNLGPVKGREKIDQLLTFPFKIADFDFTKMEDSIDMLKTYSTQGIGGRDATIIASMKENDIEKLLTHDKAFKRIEEIKVVDPVERSA